MYSKEFRQRLLQVLRESTGNIKAALNFPEFKGKLNRSTVYLWRDTYPEFKEELDDIKEGWIDDLETSALKYALEGDSSLIRFILRTQGKDRGYVERTENVISVPDGLTVNWKEIPVNERKAMLATIKSHAVTKPNP